MTKIVGVIVIWLLLILSQFYSLLLIDLGLWIAVFIVLFLPLVLINVFPNNSHEKSAQAIIELVYLAALYFLIGMIPGIRFLQELGFWKTLAQHYDSYVLNAFFRDTLLFYKVHPAGILVIPAIVSTISYCWMIYVANRLFGNAKKRINELRTTKQ